MRRFHPLITGTLILTSVGFFCRILGFFYRIFLSRTIGAEGLGLYQMIFPIHGIAFALCAGPIQTSLSRLTAASPEKGRAFLRVSLALSLSIALPLTSLIYTFADFLAALTCVVGVRVLPYHNLSGTKYESLDLRYPLATVDTPIPTAAETEAARDVLAARGIRVLR